MDEAGITDRRIDASRGLDEADVALLKARHVGITNLVNVATARADELSVEQLRRGADRLRALVVSVQPKVVAVVGLTAFRQAFAQPRAAVGRQPEGVGPAELWVLPNPSGLNAHETIASLAAAYRRVAVAAGIV